MMAPVQISASAVIRRWTEQGPFYYNGNRFVVLSETASPFKIGVFRSTDRGFSWTEQDSANKLTPHSSFSTYSVFEAGATLYMLFIDASGFLNIGSFNMSTSLWSTLITGGPDVSAIGLSNRVLLVRKSGGDFVAMYSSNVASDKTTRYVTCTSGGSWGSPVTITGTNRGSVYSVGIDSADRTYIVMGYAQGVPYPTPPDAPLALRTLTSGGTLNSEVVISNSLHSAGTGSVKMRVWTPDGGAETVSVLFSNALRWTFMGNSDVSFQGCLGHAYGSPGDTPSFTIEDASDGSFGFTTAAGLGTTNEFGAAVLAGKLYAHYVVPGDLTYDMYCMRKDASGWRSPRKLHSTVGDATTRRLINGFNGGRELPDAGRIGFAFGLYTGSVSVPHYIEI